MKFEVGQKVICVDDILNRPPVLAETYPIKGSIYTVRDIVSGYGIRLMEIVNPTYKYRNGIAEVAFDQKRFDPIEYIVVSETSEATELVKELVKETQIGVEDNHRVVTTQ